MNVVALKIRGMLKVYQSALTRRPYLMQALQTAALMGTGDLISQTLVEKKYLQDVDYKRTIQFSSIGLFVGIPARRTVTMDASDNFPALCALTEGQKTAQPCLESDRDFLLKVLKIGTLDKIMNMGKTHVFKE